MAHYRMKQLMELTGMSRQAIHFYIKKGLVPPPINRTRTSAEYTDDHVQRILAVRRMSQEQFLPLDAIKASFDRRDEDYTPQQRRVISGIRTQFGGARRPATRATSVALGTVARQTKVPKEEIQSLADTGLLEAIVEGGGRIRIAKVDVPIVELWSELRSSGFGPDDGLGPEDLGLYVKCVNQLVAEQAVLVTGRLADRPPALLAKQLEAVLPVVDALVARLHDRAVRMFLANLMPATDD